MEKAGRRYPFGMVIPPFLAKKTHVSKFSGCRLQPHCNCFLFMPPYLYYRPADHGRSPMFKMANGKIFLILII
jgi:hypothetical protein